MDKAQLRERMRALRDAIPEQQRNELSEAVCRNAAPLAAAGETVFIYAAVGSEVQTDGLIRALWDCGCRVCLPVVKARGHMEARLHLPDVPLVKGRWNIPEPAAGELVPPEAIDVAFIPLLAFDRSGGRLGYGGGYYDRFLRDCPARRIALAYAQQAVGTCPCEPWDVRMDAIMNETGVYVVQK